MEFFDFGQIANFSVAGLVAAIAMKSLDSIFNRTAQKDIEKIKGDIVKIRDEKISETQKERDLNLSLQSYVHNLSAKRYEYTLTRRVDAALGVWKIICEFDRFAMEIKFYQGIKLIEASKASETDRYKIFGALFDSALELIVNEKGKFDTRELRPFLSDPLWLLFECYSNIHITILINLKAVREGLYHTDIINKKVDIGSKVALAFPENAENLIGKGADELVWILPTIKARCLREIQRTLDGEEDERYALGKLAKIFEQSDVGPSSLA